MKKVIKNVSAIIAVSLVLCLSGCNSDKVSSKSTQASQKNDYELFEEQLKTLDNVISVERVNGDSDFKATFKVYFNSLLEPGNITNEETFVQKALVGFSGYDKPNTLIPSGYSLGNDLYPNSRNEIAYWLEGNLIEIEHRYFGESIPTGRQRSDGNYDGSYWQYLTTKNAAEDVHAFVTQLKKLLKGNWIVSGEGLSGRAEELYCYYHDEDVDVTLATTAPVNKNGISTEEDARQRALLNEVLIWFLERRNVEYEDGITFKDKLFKEKITEENVYHNECCTPDVFYEVSVMEFTGERWKEYATKDTFSIFEKFFNLPNDEATAINKNGIEKTKKEYLFDALSEVTGMTKVYGMDLAATIIRESTGLGTYSYNFSYLRNVVEAEKAKNPATRAKITINQGNEDSLNYDLFFSEAERELFNFDNKTYNALKNYFNNSKKQTVMIYGLSSPWYNTRMNITDKDNIHIYVNPAYGTFASIVTFDKASRNEIVALIKEHLG